MKTQIFATAAAVVLTTTVAAFAHSGATGIVKQRMEMMKDIAGEMKTIGGMIRDAATYEPPEAVAAANRIAGHGGQILTMFPEGSTKAPSQALPVIWQDWEEFSGLVEDLEDRARELARTAETAEDVSAIRSRFVALGRTCAKCHEDFRKAQ